MIRLRRAHPTLGRSRFWREDVHWFGTGSALDMGRNSRTLALYLDGASQRDVDLYMLINGSDRTTTFEIQVARPGGWRRVLDTGLKSPDDFPEPAATAPPLAGTSDRLEVRSIALLCAAGRESPPRRDW